ncbi:hypothetical protein HY486_02570 [Candidatus Woesearchaeota archaeon]|nr:hypothetical protein [Candidatus Woesearchaeota archaeon]
MYSWGDDRSAWKNPKAYDFGSAKKAYVDKVGKSAGSAPRTYLEKTKPKLELVDPLNREVATDSEEPVIIAVDGTGSMQSWPAEIFDRLPLLCQTVGGWKQNAEISFAVLGDAFIDNWPLQVTDFGKGPSLDKLLDALKPEGGGGGGARESYELFAYFVSEHVKTPKATSPFLFIMGDEGFYDLIRKDQAKTYIGDTLDEDVNAKKTIDALCQRFDVYLLRKQYSNVEKDKQIRAQWADAIGDQRIIPVTDPQRIVDVTMGLIAKKWGQYDDFKANLSARQDSGSIKTVMDSLRAAPEIDKTMKSKVTGAILSKKSKALEVTE